MTSTVREMLSPAEWAARAPVLRDEGWVLLDLHGVDRLGLTRDADDRGRFEIVCHLVKRDDASRMVVHVGTAGDPPTVGSVTHLWGTAGFAERETYDMYGIVFDGHADLTRILMPDDWDGHHAARFYQEWPSVKTALDNAIAKLDEISDNIMTVNTNTQGAGCNQ